MDRVDGNFAAVLERARVGDELDRGAALAKRGGERDGGEEMAAGAARSEQDRPGFGHAASAVRAPRTASGRLRVSAMRKPMPRPSATSDEPP